MLIDNNDGFLWQFRFHQQPVLDWLKQRREREKANQTAPLPLAVTLAVKDFSALSSLYKGVLDASTYNDDQGNIYGDVAGALCFYWTGNLLDYLLDMAETTTLQEATIYSPEVHRGMQSHRQSHKWEMVGGIVVKVLKVPHVPGILIRAFNFHASSHLLPVEKQLRRQGKLVSMPPDEGKRWEQIVSYAMSSIVNYWSWF